LVEGDRLLLFGPTATSLAGSRWAAERGAVGGTLDAIAYDLHLAVATLTRRLVAAGLCRGVHDVSTGGIGLALAEMAVRSGVGFSAARVGDHRALFAEGPSRVVLSVAPDQLTPVLRAAEHAGVPVVRLGLATGDRLQVKDLFDVSLADARNAWRGRLPA